MPLNDTKGNMYDFITHTWNTVKGECPHNCSYCYMKRWGRLRAPRLDEKEFRTDLGKDNFLFVGSSNDMFAADHPEEWILRTLDYCNEFDNRYLFQSKNPARILKYIQHPVFKKAVVCTTLETDEFIPDVMCKSPCTMERSECMSLISQYVPTYVTIEPVMKFNPYGFIEMIRSCNPAQVNIGADSGRNNLNEPSKEDVLNLVEELSQFTTINKKTNLKRLMG